MLPCLLARIDAHLIDLHAPDAGQVRLAQPIALPQPPGLARPKAAKERERERERKRVRGSEKLWGEGPLPPTLTCLTSVCSLIMTFFLKARAWRYSDLYCRLAQTATRLLPCKRPRIRQCLA